MMIYFNYKQGINKKVVLRMCRIKRSENYYHLYQNGKLIKVSYSKKYLTIYAYEWGIDDYIIKEGVRNDDRKVC